MAAYGSDIRKVIAFAEITGGVNDTDTSNFDTGAEQILAKEIEYDLLESNISNDNRRLNHNQKFAQIKTTKADSTLKVSLYLHGNPDAVASGSQATRFYQSKLGKMAYGGERRSYSVSVSGGTTSAPILDSLENVTVGDVLWFASSAAGTSEYPGVVIDTTAATNTVTLLKALPFSPVSGTIASGSVATYIDNLVNNDYTNSNHTLGDFAVAGDGKNSSSINETFVEILKTKLGPGLGAIAPGDPVTEEYNGLVTDFNTDISSSYSLTASNPSGVAGSAPGRGTDSKFYFGNRDSAEASVLMHNLTPNIGLSWNQVRTVTGRNQVEFHYAPPIEENGTLEATLEFSSSYSTDYQNGTNKSATYVQNGAVGNRFAIIWTNLELMREQEKVDQDGVLAGKLMMITRQYSGSQSSTVDDMGASNREVARSPVIIVR